MGITVALRGALTAIDGICQRSALSDTDTILYVSKNTHCTHSKRNRNEEDEIH